MADKPTPKPRKPKVAKADLSAPLPLKTRALGWIGRGLTGVAGFFGLLIVLYSFVPVPTTLYMMGESVRLGGVERDWVGWDDITPAMARSVVAAEDANFCLHWGFDMAEIRKAVEAGSNRGASTLSQQVVKNTFLWHGRSWLRKAMEAALTPVVELVWSKRRILEVYLNVAEFGEGVFGVEAAAQHHFGVTARDLTDVQAARLAAVLPDPKGRSASNPSDFVRRRTRSILSGAETILADGRAACFEE
jgi:monofunctional biosynthetic peptidoglycan transglycosylase